MNEGPPDRNRTAAGESSPVQAQLDLDTPPGTLGRRPRFSELLVITRRSAPLYAEPAIQLEQPVTSETPATISVPTAAARTRATEAEYDCRIRMQYTYSTARRQTDPQQPPIVSPVDVVSDLIERASTLAANTGRLYRAALLWHCAKNRDRAREFEEAYHLLATTELESSAAKRTSKRTISEADLDLLTSVLAGMNHGQNWGWGKRTQAWLHATLATGIRPKEWLNAAWIDDSKTALRVQSGKLHVAVPSFLMVTPGETIHDVEANHPERIRPAKLQEGIPRTRDVPVDPHHWYYVDRHLEELTAHLGHCAADHREGRYLIYYNLCRKKLQSACARAFKGKKNYSLYTMRSQFSANKKAVLPLGAVAELMGNSPTTAVRYYGPRRAAHGGWAFTERAGHAQTFPQRQSGDRAAGDPEAAPIGLARAEV